MFDDMVNLFNLGGFFRMRKKNCMHTLLQRQELCSADSVFREWSFVQRDFWIRTQTRRETRSRLRCATTSAAAPDIKKSWMRWN